MRTMRTGRRRSLLSGPPTRASTTRRGASTWWLSEPALTGTTSLTLIRVRMPRGTGHQFHVHPELDEIIYVVEGVAEQWVDRDRRRLRKGEIAYIPKGVVHATYNTTKRPLIFLAILSPAASKGPALIDYSNKDPRRTLQDAGRVSRRGSAHRPLAFAAAENAAAQSSNENVACSRFASSTAREARNPKHQWPEVK